MSKQGVLEKAVELLESNNPWVAPATIYLAYHGSRAYGTAIEGSDTDIRGMFVPPLKVISDPYESKEQVGHHDQRFDILIFDFRKLLKLAAQGNPNITESFWVDKESWIWSTPLWEMVHSHRESFLSKEMGKRFIGYSLGELKSLKLAYSGGVPATSVRYELYEKYGFDTKAAMHATRVSRMCKELINEGKIIIKRPDAEELKRIRNGRCSIEHVIEEVSDNLMQATNSLNACSLPDSVDKALVQSLCREILTERLYGSSV